MYSGNGREGMTRRMPPQRTQVRNLLAAGFGVEDIHVKTGFPLDCIRFYVRAMRASGELADIYGSGR